MRVVFVISVVVALFSCRGERGPTKIKAQFINACDRTPVVAERIKVVGSESTFDILKSTDYLVFEKEVSTDENGVIEFVFEPHSFAKSISLYAKSGLVGSKSYSDNIDFETFYKASPEKYSLTLLTDSVFNTQDTLFFFSTRFSSPKFVVGPRNNQVVTLESDNHIVEANQFSTESSSLFFTDLNDSIRSTVSMRFSRFRSFGIKNYIRAFEFSLCDSVLRETVPLDSLK
jgi:hypothetical protein